MMNDSATERVKRHAGTEASFFYSLIFSTITAVSITFTNTFLPLLYTLALVRRSYVILVEVVISLISFFLLTVFGKEYLFIFTVRALSYINLYFIMSEYVDYTTVLDLLGERGVPIVVGLSYYPLFYRIAKEINFNARARKIGFKPYKLLLPFIVEMVKVAEDLYIAYTIKLYGKYRGKINLFPRKFDLVLLTSSLIALIISLYPPHFLEVYNIVT
jgi:hypothetical protein